MHAEPSGADGKAEGGSEADAGSAGEALDTVPLASNHLVKDFSCKRSERVEKFLHRDARDFVKTGSARVFVCPNPEDQNCVWGYYTLSASSLSRQNLEKKFQNRLPAGIPAPVALLGYMGRHDGAPPGLGAGMISDAARRVARIDAIGIWGMMLHAETPGVAAWYESVGFIRAPELKSGDPILMYAPIKSLLV